MKYNFLFSLLLMQSCNLLSMDVEQKYLLLKSNNKEASNASVQWNSYQYGQVPLTTFDTQRTSHEPKFIDKEDAEKELTALRKQIEQKNQELAYLPDYASELQKLEKERKMQYHNICAWLSMGQFPYYFSRIFIDQSDPTTNKGFTSANWPGWANFISDPLGAIGSVIVPGYCTQQKEKIEGEEQ